MNKTLNINLAGFVFHVDEDAYQHLDRYLRQLKNQFSGTQGGAEIIADIESRIAELFKEKTAEREVITKQDVEDVIAIMGKPEDFLLEDDIETEAYSSQAGRGGKRIFRDPDNRVIGGVSSGVAAYFNIDSIWIRLLFLVLFFSGPGIFIYLVMWLVIPKARTTAEKLQMRGQNVTIENIERSVKDGIHDVGKVARSYGQKARDYDYGRSAKNAGGFFNDLGNFLRDAFRLIFKVLFKIIGAIFIIFGFVLLISIISSLAMGGVTLVHTTYNPQELLSFMELITIDESHFNWIATGVILTVLAPLFLIFYFGIRLLFNVEPLNKQTRSGLALLTVVGIIMTIGSGVRLGAEFREEASNQREIPLGQEDHYFLDVSDDLISKRFVSGDYDFWLPLGEDKNAFSLLEVDIRQSNTGEAYASLIRYSNGSSARQAKSNARSIEYEILKKDSIIQLPAFYLLEGDDRFRAQHLEVILYLTPGQSIFIDDRITPYLDDVKNLQNTWDLDMGNQRWIMTERGLTCEDCEIPLEEAESILETSESVQVDSLAADSLQNDSLR